MAGKQALKHDAQGFLVGDAVDLGKLTTLWSAIRDDVHAIRQAVLGIKTAANQAEAQPNVATPRRRETALIRAANAEPVRPTATPQSKRLLPYAQPQPVSPEWRQQAPQPYE